MDFDLDDMVRVIVCQDSAYRRDDCGDWIIGGKAGHIYATPEGFYLYCDPGSARAWTFAKRALSFCRVTQDGDEDGFLLLDRLPTAEECEIIRDKLAIRKKREISEGERARLSEMLSRTAFKPGANRQSSR